jgi:hypothetical protein
MEGKIGSKGQVLTGKADKTKKGQSIKDLTLLDRRAQIKATKSQNAKASPWTAHVRKYAEKNNMTFACALSDVNCKKKYQKKKMKNYSAAEMK